MNTGLNIRARVDVHLHVVALAFGRKRISGFAIQPDSVAEAKIPEYLPVLDVGCNLAHFLTPLKNRAATHERQRP
jgi:hypothetical protein